MPKSTSTRANTTPAKAAPAKNAGDEKSLAQRIDAERAYAEKIFRELSAASVSIPVKPLSGYRKAYKRAVGPHPNGRKPSVRQAAALAVAALAAGKNPAKTGVKFPRKFTLSGADYVLENGALSSALRAGLCAYDAESETITISAGAEIASLLGPVSKLPEITQ